MEDKSSREEPGGGQARVDESTGLGRSTEISDPTGRQKSTTERWRAGGWFARLKQRSGDEWVKNHGLNTAEMINRDGWQVCLLNRCRAVVLAHCTDN